MTFEEKRKAINDLRNMAIPEYSSLYSSINLAIEALANYDSAEKMGRWIDADVLDKIRAELHATAEMHEDGYYYLREEWIDEIFDKYKAEGSDKE